MTRWDRPVGVVTGASRGLGAAAAVALARRGVHVVLLARTEGGLAETDDAVRAVGGSATLLPIDVGAGEALDPLGPTLLQRFGRLDILVHAAAQLGCLTPAPHITPKDWAAARGAGPEAAFRLIRTCGPLLVAAEAGRAVFVTDGVASAPRAFWGIYAAAKAATEALARCWAEEHRNDRLRVNLFDPGPMRTRLRAQIMPGEDPALVPPPAGAAETLAEMCMPGEMRTGVVVREAPWP